MEIKKRVVVGMSGGVDSSVVAALLKKQRYEVIGVFLRFWQPPAAATLTHADKKFNADSRGICENTCCNQEALRQARKVASILDIPFYVLDVSKKFKKAVVDYYINEYQNGRTPNPCVECNKFIKFGWLLDKAKELGAEFVATGHYARIKSTSGKSKVYKSKTRGLVDYRLMTSADKQKDQTYFLWQLDQNQLKHILFPIGDYTKTEVRKLAKKFKLPVAEKKESQGICFIPDRDNVGFLQRYAKKLSRPGDIIDIKGNVLGKHKGLACYTIGQRHGLEGIQLKTLNPKLDHSTGSDRPEENRTGETLNPDWKSRILDSKNRDKSQIQNIFRISDLGFRVSAGFPPAYVVKLNIEKNELVVGEEKDLYQKELIATNVNWISSCNMYHVTCNKGFNCRAKIRYGHPSSKCKIQKSKFKNIIKVIFEKPQRAITPGQSIVFYKQNQLIGGAVIK